MQNNTSYLDVIAEVHGFLRDRAHQAIAAGLPRESVWLDPGIGFGKSLEGNLKLISALPDLAATGHTIVLGTSRKSFIGAISDAPTDQRLAGSLASLLPALTCQRAIVRVHDVAQTLQFLDVATQLRKVAG
jgi:dihydropteroate synthase